MTSAGTLSNTIPLSLFRNIKEGMENGRIANLNTAQTEVEAAIAELSGRPLPEGPIQINDLVGKLFLEIGSLHEKVARCESQLAEFEFRAAALKEEASQIVARTEACSLRVEQQQKENSKVLATVEGMRDSVSTTPAPAPAPAPPCLAPAPSPLDTASFPAPSRPAVISFPGGPRTVTIHPPGSPNYQSTIRDENGDVIIALKGTKPLRREGAFRGPIEDIDWTEICRVHGRAPELGGSRGAPPVRRWPDLSQQSPCPPPSRGPNGITARQHQLSTPLQTDAFGRVLAPDFLPIAKPPSVPTGLSSSDSSQLSSGENRDVVTTPFSTPPPPSVGRGKKRARDSEEDESVATTTETSEGQATKEPRTPTLVKREESHPPIERPTRRKRLRSSAPVEVLSAGTSR